jgi:hypothetical protein
MFRMGEGRNIYRILAEETEDTTTKIQMLVEE